MDFLENIREGLRSIAGNRLRTILTSLIIAIGIMSLVGILTAIDGIQGSVNSSFEGLGANTFSIATRQEVARIGGRVRQLSAPIDYREATAFKQRFHFGATIAIATTITGVAEVKAGSKKTNPNVQLIGADDAYLPVKGYKVAAGRNFSANDLNKALNVTIIGTELANTLFERKISPINQVIRALGNQYKIIGVLDKKGGGVAGGGEDRVMLVPLDNARALASTRALTFEITASAPDLADQDVAMGEARGLMRRIRRDPPGKTDSFQIERADDLAKSIGDITGYLRIGGFGIGFVTLLGASIALMNIMLVSVTERTREIGIRKSLGATPKRIRQQFLIEAIVICILGGLGGVVMGLGIGNLIAMAVSQGSGGFVVPWTWMGLGLIVCIGVGLFSGIYPAIRASKLDPIEALRYE